MPAPSNRTAPLARLAAKIAALWLVVSVRIHPSPQRACTRWPSRPQTLQRHLTADFARVEVRSIAGVFHGAPVHDSKIVTEFAGKVEILLDQHDCDVAKAAQVSDGAPDILDDR